MAILVIFWSIFGDRMANLGMIDFKIGLYIKVNVNVKSLSNKLDKMAINWHKIGQMPLWRMNINGHNLFIFHTILKFFFCCKRLVF